MTNLVDHARRELDLSGQTEESPAYAAALIAAVAAFASYDGHSGGSAAIAVEHLHALLQFRTLSPLTPNPDEWIDRTDMSSAPLWQSVRDPSAMSRDGGQTHYFVDDRGRWVRTVRCPECRGGVTGHLLLGDSWPKHKRPDHAGCPYPSSAGAVIRAEEFTPDPAPGTTPWGAKAELS